MSNNQPSNQSYRQILEIVEDCVHETLMYEKKVALSDHTPVYGRLEPMFRQYVDELVKQAAILMWPE
tara:strand:- start:740 stop:940 length:201 start_codon:yes stop_codon:yes gene_type:complete